MNRQRWLRTRRRLKKRSAYRASLPTQQQWDEFKAAAPKPYADYVPDMPWERRL